MKKNIQLITLFCLLASSFSMHAANIKVATFNVSMEALNYTTKEQQQKTPISGQTIINALNSNHAQIRNIAEIIQRVNPDIILLNEFDNSTNSEKSNHAALNVFITQYLNVSQNGQKSVDYKYVYQGPVNTGVNSNHDLDNNGVAGQLPADGYGYGHFSGHFGMALLSKYPIDEKQIRTFQHFKWKDMPGALRPFDPETKKPWHNELTWNDFRLSSKSHWDIPVNVNGTQIHILASHPTPPVFDGKEDRNGKRNHDEIRFWSDYISPNSSEYIYDDKGQVGGLKDKVSFVLLGDLNATTVEGNAIKSGIQNLLSNERIQDPLPNSIGALQHSSKSKHGKYHTAFWRMRVDYVLPSVSGLQINDSGVFWPTKDEHTFGLIKDRSASSDHRLVWVDLTLSN